MMEKKVVKKKNKENKRKRKTDENKYTII